MTSAQEARSEALDAFLRQREAEGYRIETRAGLQAVICRRHRLHFVLRLLAHRDARRRLLISVDQQAHITSVAVEPAA
ncbi:MAG TPA: hypothetical protein VFV91_05120 [Gaiellaceae bacterium]|jgi:hypothetical protein|nr:hypothetical protein [Gaiellaceae bacterium]